MASWSQVVHDDHGNENGGWPRRSEFKEESEKHFDPDESLAITSWFLAIQLDSGRDTKWRWQSHQAITCWMWSSSSTFLRYCRLLCWSWWTTYSLACLWTLTSITTGLMNLCAQSQYSITAMKIGAVFLHMAWFSTLEAYVILLTWPTMWLATNPTSWSMAFFKFRPLIRAGIVAHWMSCFLWTTTTSLHWATYGT